MVTQHCLNVVSTSVPNVERDVAKTLTQHCLNFVSTLADVGQHCDNIVAMLGLWSKYNVGATFTQHCLNVHTTLLERLNVSTNGRRHNVGTNVGKTLAPTLWQRSHNVGTLAGAWVYHHGLFRYPLNCGNVSLYRVFQHSLRYMSGDQVQADSI